MPRLAVAFLVLLAASLGACRQVARTPALDGNDGRQPRTMTSRDVEPLSVDGQGTTARFGFPAGLAFDTRGNLYVADRRDHVIRIISPAGDVRIFAGSPGHPGHVDGAGRAARFQIPMGIAIDRHDTVYVADAGNEAIRRITPTGEVSTLVGAAGIAGASDGAAEQASFDYPQGIAVDGNSNLYVTCRDTIRKIRADVTVVTLAGSRLTTRPNGDPYADGIGLLARFNDPMGLAVDDAATIYVADTGNFVIRRIDTRGWVSTLAGTPQVAGTTDGIGTAASFQRPRALAVDHSGDVYVADCRGPMVRRVSPSGVTTTMGPDGCANGIAIDSAGAVYLSVFGKAPGIHRLGSILKITPAGEVTTFAGPDPQTALAEYRAGAER
jgi:sugar lactone lactonase YvrE